MYDELVKKMRRCATDPMHCLSCGEDKDGRCFKRLMTQAADAIEELTAKVSSLQFFADNISNLPDCNTCLKKNLCEFMPKYGEYCRINCPAWLGQPPMEES